MVGVPISCPFCFSVFCRISSLRLAFCSTWVDDSLERGAEDYLIAKRIRPVAVVKSDYDRNATHYNRVRFGSFGGRYVDAK